MSKEIDCPSCDAVILLAGDEKNGDQVFCSYCGSPFIFKKGKSDEGFEIEEDY